jgi:hypothetical protein
MANSPSLIDLQNESLAQFLAKAISNGTFSDVITTTKVDNPGEEATATQIALAAGQLWSNVFDDFLRAMYGLGYRANKLWGVANTTEREALGSDDALAVEDLAWVQSTHEFWYCTAVTGPGTSTWAQVSGGGGGGEDLEATLVLGNHTGGLDIELDNPDGILSDSGFPVPLKSTDGDAVPVAQLTASGSNGAATNLHSGTRDPNALVTGQPGALYVRVDGVSSTLYQVRTVSPSTTWTEVVGGGGGGGGEDLEATLTIGNTTGGIDLLLGASTLIAGVSNPVQLQRAAADTAPILSVESTGTNGAIIQMFAGDRIPVGNVTGNPGDLYVEAAGASSRMYQHEGVSPSDTGWVELGAGSGGGESFAATLAIGNETGGTDVIISSGDGILGDTGVPIPMTSNGGDVVPVVTFSSSGANSATAALHVGDRNPNGFVTANPGSLYAQMDGTSSTLYQIRTSASSNTWTVVGGTPTLAAVLTAGNTTGGSDIELTGSDGILSAVGSPVPLLSTDADTVPAVQLDVSGANGATTDIHSGTQNPNETVTGQPGALYVRIAGTSSNLYQQREATAGTTWQLVTPLTPDLGNVLGVDNSTGGTDIEVQQGDAIVGQNAPAPVDMRISSGIATSGGNDGADIFLDPGVGDGAGAQGNVRISSRLDIPGGIHIIPGGPNPEGFSTANPGSLYLTNLGELWLKQSGSGDTGWAELSAGAATLAATLASGNTTGGEDLEISSGDRITMPGGMQIISGSPQPDNNITATPGSFYMQNTGQLWVKQSGSGDTGWSKVGPNRQMYQSGWHIDSNQDNDDQYINWYAPPSGTSNGDILGPAIGHANKLLMPHAGRVLGVWMTPDSTGLSTSCDLEMRIAVDGSGVFNVVDTDTTVNLASANDTTFASIVQDFEEGDKIAMKFVSPTVSSDTNVSFAMEVEWYGG